MKLSPERAEALGAPALIALRGSLRWYYIGWEEIAEEAVTRGIILSFWHNRILGTCLAPVFRNFKTTTLISDHRDGEIITRLIARLGHGAVRGSSGEGKGGMRGLAALAKETGPGKIAAITPDGPRGPRYRVQPGVALLAQKTGLRIVPYAPSAATRWKADSWDRFEMLLPFTKVHAFFGPPLAVAPEEELGAAMRRVEEAMHAATAASEAYWGRTPEPPGDAG